MGTRGARLAYVPALDGLRALAVAAVLLFHADLGWAQGGFLGVSVFFTLSGFLITSLLLAEHEATGSISLCDFFARRLRRLVPAAYVCLLLVLLFGLGWGAAQRQHLPGDVVAAVLDVANWRFAFAHTSYQDLFLGAPSPLAHFWSLAIEEQCYLLLPLLAWWALRRSRRAFAALTVALLVLSVAATLLTHDADLVYYGTHTRAAELLVGVLLALAMHHRSLPDRWRGIVATLGASVLLVAVVESSIGDRWLYRGGLPAISLASAALIVGLTGRTAMASALSRRPLVAVGKVSYGVYLYHWPIFLLLSPQRTGLDRWPLLAARLIVTAAVTVASYRWIEQPVRQRRVLSAPRSAITAMSATMVVVAIAGMVAVPRPQFTATEALLARGDAGLIELTAGTASATAVGSLPTTPTVPRVLVVGSNADPIAALRERGWDVVDGVQPGCPVADAAQVRLRDGTVLDTGGCDVAAQRWARLVAEQRPTVVVVALGRLDTGIVRRADDVGFPVPSDVAEAGRRMAAAEAQLRSAIETLLASGVPLVLFDAVPVGAAFDSGLDTIAITLGLPGAVLRTVAATVAAVDAQLGEGDRAVAAADPLRLLVIGDSTSLHVAQALSDGAAGGLQVTWAGANGCPFVRAEATRPSAEEPWRVLDCEPFDEKLPPLLERFRPDLVLLVVGPMELVEQRYPGDPAPHVAGDAAFTAFHDTEMAALVDLLRGNHLPLLVSDSPPLTAGGWASAEMADAERVAAWNAQVARWDVAWSDVSTLPLAAAVATYEAEHGSIRSDGVHPDVGPLTELARAVLLPLVMNSDL